MTEGPKSQPSAQPGALLKDLPAQPVEEKEAEGVKGGIAAVPPDPCAPLEINSVRPGSIRQR
jgi:hypothetical protein